MNLREIEIRYHEEEECTCDKHIIVVFVDVSESTWTCLSD